MNIQRTKDPSNPSELEQKHSPVIEVIGEPKKGEKLNIKIKVGEITHPSLPEHYIMWIKLFKGDELVGEKILNPGDSPEAEFSLSIEESSTLLAQEECNLHGAWESEKEITIN